jgi:hypothetical protein
MRAGYGIIDITPPMGVELAGYGYYLGRKCESVRDPLYMRAVMLEQEGSRQLIVSCDVLGLSQETADRIIREAADFGVPRERVMIVSIHTHTGPVIKYHNGCGEVDEGYTAALAEKARPLLEAAEADLAEVTRLCFARGLIPGDEIYNRAAPDGPVDRNARGFLIERKGKKPILMAGAACHGVFLRAVTSVSADFSGELHKRCAEKGILSIYLNGVCGDIDPWKPKPEKMAAFAAKILETLENNLREVPATMKGGRLPFTLRLNYLTRDGIRAAAARAVEKAGGPQAGPARSALAWEEEMLRIYGSLAAEEPGDAACCVLGGIPILAIPFEGYTGIGTAFRRLTGEEDAMVLGCAEQLRGYLPTKDDFERESYAAMESMFLYRRFAAMPGEAERLAEQLAEQYRKTFSKE